MNKTSVLVDENVQDYRKYFLKNCSQKEVHDLGALDIKVRCPINICQKFKTNKNLKFKNGHCTNY